MPAAKRWKIAAVASRKQLCVNPKVKSHSAAWRINDECLQLQSKEGSKKQALFGMSFLGLPSSAASARARLAVLAVLYAVSRIYMAPS